MKKKEKGILDLREITKQGQRTMWKDSIGSNIYYTVGEKEYAFKLVDYIQSEQYAKLEYEGNVYGVKTSGILYCQFGNIIGTCVKDFRFSVGDIIKTKRKECEVLKTFRNHKGKKSYECKCLDCGNIKSLDEDHMINRGFVCASCSDKVSYPERVMISILNQLGVKYEYQKKFEWAKDLKTDFDNEITCKFYDFYVPSLNTIIEVHGEIHYKEGRWSRCRPISEIKENDKFKRELALKNGVKEYIEVDCMESDIEYIKNSIIDGVFGKIFDIANVDWYKCDLDSCVSLMKVCSDLWNEGVRPTREIANKVGISKQTVISYLKKFAKLGLNDYDPRKELKTSHENIPFTGKSVCVYKDGEALGTFKSTGEVERMSVDLFGVKLLQSRVASVCRGERKHHKGYTFNYI